MKKQISLSKDLGKRRGLWFGISSVIVILLVGGYWIFREYARTGVHFMRLRQFWEDPQKYSHWGLSVGDQCGKAPFLVPTDGFVAFFWGDRYRTGARHQGIDIFSPEGSKGIGLTPVVAVHDGYLTRLPEWRSAVIIRIPDDPLHHGRQVWTYYTHMADEQGIPSLLMISLLEAMKCL